MPLGTQDEVEFPLRCTYICARPSESCARAQASLPSSIGILGLGMGANAALFSIIDRVILHPFNYRAPDRLVHISGRWANGRDSGISPAELEYWENRVPAFGESAIWHWRDLTLTGVEDPESLWALEVSPHTFDILGVPPIHGRLFRPDDFRKDAPPVVIIGYRLWQRHFHGDAALIGRQILFDHQATRSPESWARTSCSIGRALRFGFR